MTLTYAQGIHKSMYVNILRMLSVIDNGNKMHIFVYIYKYTYIFIHTCISETNKNVCASNK